MKNVFKIFSTIVLAVVFGIYFTTCDNSTSPNVGGDTRVDIISFNDKQLYIDDTTIVPGTFNENISFLYFFVGDSYKINEFFTDYSVEVVNGKLSLDLGIPKTSALLPIKDSSGYSFGGVVSGTNADSVKGLIFIGIKSSEGNFAYAKPDWSFFTLFVYVDNEVKLEGDWFYDLVFNNITLNQGWNTLLVDNYDSDDSIRPVIKGAPASDYIWIID